MSVIVFCGPSLSFAQADALLPEAHTLGPAACGDVYKVARHGARSIVLLDGFFDHRLSVWHKEILWALSRGIRVYGAASMGALRAAELAPYGMTGVGWVFQQFRDGLLEDDDEVAVVHAPAERNFAPLSEAMVNLRVTLANAVTDKVLTSEEASSLIAELKRLFYPHRDKEALMRIAGVQLAAAQHQRFEIWLEQGGIVNQKRLDAELVLKAIAAEPLRTNAPPPTFRLETTDAFQTLCSRVDREALGAASAQPTTPDKVGGNLDAAPGPADPLKQPAQLSGLKQGLAALERQDSALAHRIIREATERALALVLAKQNKTSVSSPVVQSASEQFRHERGLFSPEHTSAWLTSNDLDLATFSALIHDEVMVERYRSDIESMVCRELPNTLRRLGLLDRVLACVPRDD